MLSAPSPHTGRPYARSTINDCIRTVCRCRYFVWAQPHRLIVELPFEYVDVSVRPSHPQRMLAHLNRKVVAPSHLVENDLLMTVD
jgi:hypothetical protein